MALVNPHVRCYLQMRRCAVPGHPSDFYKEVLSVLLDENLLRRPPLEADQEFSPNEQMELTQLMSLPQERQ